MECLLSFPFGPEAPPEAGLASGGSVKCPPMAMAQQTRDERGPKRGAAGARRRPARRSLARRGAPGDDGSAQLMLNSGVLSCLRRGLSVVNGANERRSKLFLRGRK